MPADHRRGAATPIERYYARFHDVTNGDTAEEVLDKAGLDMWEEPALRAGGPAHRQLHDPATGDATRVLLFECAATADPHFPRGWPFVSKAACSAAVTTVGDRAVTTMEWPLDGQPAPLMARITDAMATLGWHAHLPTEPWSTASTDVLLWYHRADEWRILAHVPRADPPALVLLEYDAALRERMPAEQG